MGERVPVKEGIYTEDAPSGALVANKCNSCGQVFFPKAQFCLNCFGENVEDIVLSRRGKLYSYTTGYMPSTHFAPPYAVGYVDMPEGVRVFAPLKMVDEKPFAVNMEVEVSIEKLWEEGGKDFIGFRFRPV